MHSQRFSGSNIKRQKGEKGVALVTMLLLLLLLTALSISMVLAFSSDALATGFYRNSRASFYAADAGATTVREDIVNRFNSMIPNPLPVGASSPLPSNASAIVSAINAAYGSWVAVNSSGSFSESFELYTPNTSLTLYQCTVSTYTDSTQTTKNTPVTSTATSLTSSTTCPVLQYAYDYTYTYHYSLTTVGMTKNTGGTAVTDAGNIIIDVPSGETISSFSQYGTFIDQMDICSAELVGGTYSGMQFTNGSWNFGSGQSYVFTGAVGSHGTDAGYMFSGSCVQSSASSATQGKTTISPNFQQGFTPGQNEITLPTNEYNQASAVLTGEGISTSGTAAPNPTTAQLSAGLKDSSGNNSYSASTSTGVFVPVGSTGTIDGGGIWVQGNANVTLSSSGSTSQVYTITQGAPAVTTTVTITPGSTPGSGTTVMQTGSNPAVTYNGVPTQTDPDTGVVTDATLLYVDGNVTSLSGTIQNNTGVTVTAAEDITVTNNLVYQTPVVTSSGAPTAAAMAGTATQTLGLYTSGGSVYMNAPSNGANMEVDASIMTTGNNGGTCNFGSSCVGVLGVTGNNKITTLTIVGGRIQSQSMIMPAGTIGTRDVIFDTRYNGTFAPPFFPRPTVISNGAQPSTTVQRTSWVLQTAY